MKTTLYKKDTKGNTRYLKIWSTGAEMHQESGIVDTENPVLHTKVCTGKNIGKSNETTPKDQAKSEVASKVKEKLDEGYCESLESLESSTIVLPMLAKSYSDEQHKIDWDTCYIQPKLDGMRCLGDTKLISRQGKIISTCDHVLDEIIEIDLHLDGELYAHGKSFQENMRLIKKYREGETELVKYHVYDIVSPLPFTERYEKLSHEVTLGKYKHIELVKTLKITSEDELKAMHQKFLSQGYEGSILRFGKAGYLINGRSSNLLKFKDFQDIDCKIIDIVPADQRPLWGKPILEYNGKTFSAGTKMSHQEREEFLVNKQDYIGQTAEIRFFEYSEDGIPRFPVMVGTRLDK